jgi:hypothetical protein
VGGSGRGGGWEGGSCELNRVVILSTIILYSAAVQEIAPSLQELKSKRMASYRAS